MLLFFCEKKRILRERFNYSSAIVITLHRKLISVSDSIFIAFVNREKHKIRTITFSRNIVLFYIPTESGSPSVTLLRECKKAVITITNLVKTMTIVRFLTLFTSYMMLDARFTLYYSDDRQASNSIFDCIYAYLYDNARDVGEHFTRNYQLIPYCRRPDVNETQEETDGRTNVDCLDGTDEIDATILNNRVMRRLDCNSNPMFLCEERSCRHAHSFSCGDGECVLFSMNDSVGKQCFSRRRMEITRVMLTSNDDVSNIACQQTLRCLIRISNNVSHSCSVSISNKFDVSRCESLSTHCFSEWVVIPKQPVLFGFFQFIYATNRSILEFETNVLSNFVCFDPQRCPALLEMNVSIELIKGLTCCHTHDIINEESIPNFDGMELLFKDVIRRCLTIGTELSCSNSFLFHCPRSLKCISYHRLVDGFKDCYFGEDEIYPACQLNDSTRFVCSWNSSICLSIVALGNLSPDCPKREDEITSSARFRLQQPPFSYLCNNRDELPLTLGGYMDEEYCE